MTLVAILSCADGTPDVSAALRSYDLLRRPRTQAITRRSPRLGAVGQLSWPPAVLLRDTTAPADAAPGATAFHDVVLGWTAPGDRVTATESESH